MMVGELVVWEEAGDGGDVEEGEATVTSVIHF